MAHPGHVRAFIQKYGGLPETVSEALDYAKEEDALARAYLHARKFQKPTGLKDAAFDAVVMHYYIQLKREAHCGADDDD